MLRCRFKVGQLKTWTPAWLVVTTDLPSGVNATEVIGGVAAVTEFARTMQSSRQVLPRSNRFIVILLSMSSRATGLYH